MNYDVSVAAEVFVYDSFSRKRAVDYRKVARGQDHSEDPPDQPNLQSISACFSSRAVREYTGFRAGKTIAYTPNTTLASMPAR